MPKVLYRVTLTQEERAALQGIAARGNHGSQKVLNALILLGCDEGAFQECKKTAARLTEVLPISMKKVDRVIRHLANDMTLVISHSSIVEASLRKRGSAQGLCPRPLHPARTLPALDPAYA